MEGTARGNDEQVLVATRPTAPARQSTRPPEPVRPLPAQRTGVSLLAVQVRRRRYRDGLPRRRS
jgi:hypothetical protein